MKVFIYEKDKTSKLVNTITHVNNIEFREDRNELLINMGKTIFVYDTKIYKAVIYQN